MKFNDDIYKFMTVKELAKKLLDSPEDTNIEFTIEKNEEMIPRPTTIWQVACIKKIFNEPYGCICYGIMGESETNVVSLIDGTLESVLEPLSHWINCDNCARYGHDCDTVCVMLEKE